MTRIPACLAVLAAAGLLFVPAGCGVGGNETPAIPQKSASPAFNYKATVYRNDTYHFRMAYRSGWVSSTWTASPSPSPQPSGSPMFIVSFADPHGNQINGNYVDAEQIAVYPLGKTVDQAYVASHTDEFSNMVHQIVDGLPGLAVPRDGFTERDLDGYPAFMLEYHFSNGSTVMWAQSMLVAEGPYAYWVTGQTIGTSWNTKWKVLWASLATFKVTGTGTASASPSASTK